MELKRLNIFANDRLIPTIIITYIVDDSKERFIKLFKMWIRKDVSEDYEIVNHANKLYYQTMIFEKTPREKHIFRNYQFLFGGKLWENYTEEKEIVFDDSAINIPPSNNYIEFYKDYMKDFVQNYSMNYTKKIKEKSNG